MNNRPMNNKPHKADPIPLAKLESAENNAKIWISFDGESYVGKDCPGYIVPAAEIGINQVDANVSSQVIGDWELSFLETSTKVKCIYCGQPWLESSIEAYACAQCGAI